MKPNRLSFLPFLVIFLTPVLVWCIGVTALMAVLVVGGVDRFWSRPVTATVDARYWTRTIAVERWDRVERADWCSDMPVGAEVLRRETRTSALGRLPRHVHHSPASPSPQPRPWCTFRIVEWTPDTPRVATAAADPRAWPDAPPPNACPAPSIGCLRGSTRTEALTLGIARPGAEPVVCVVSEAAWDRYAVGDRLEVPASVVFGRVVCDRIE